MSKNWAAAVLGVAAVQLVTVRAGAQEREDEHTRSAARGQENFGIGAQLGFFDPSGVAVRLGARAVSLHVPAGVLPVLLNYGSAREPDYKFLAPLEIAPQVLVELVEFKNEVRGGLRLGYRYNAALGSGGSFGGQLGKRFGHVLLEGAWGISIYPKAAENLRGDQVPEGASFNFPPALNWGLNVAVFYYP